MKNPVLIKWLFPVALFGVLAQTALAQAWTVNPADYQFSMNVVAQLEVGGQPDNTPGNAMAAFWHNEVRGLAAPLIWSGEARYFLTLYSNGYTGDSLAFRVYMVAGNQLLESTDTVVFLHQKILGTLAAPYVLHFGPSEKPFIYSGATASFTELVCTDSLLDVEATDNADTEGNGLAYSLDGGADVAKFAIDVQTGVLSWLNFAPDFENPGDANGNNVYEVRVKVTDLQGYTDIQTVQITVTDNLPAHLSCPANVSAGTGADGPGNCTAVVTGTCLVSALDDCSYSIGYTLSGAGTGTGAGEVPAGQLFPAGITTVTYTAAPNEPGAAGVNCSFTVTISDNEVPVFTCPPNAVRSPAYAGSNCQYTIDGGELDATATDNCSLSNFSNSINNGTTLAGLVLAMNTVTSVTWTATDAAGSTGTCVYTITVTNCNINFSGAILWKTDPNLGVNTTTVTLAGSAGATATTGTNGQYSFATTVTSGSFTITPAKNSNKLNGVTAADASAIQQHVAGNAPFTDPYKLVAADVNKSNTITSLDATIINQALLGSPAAMNQFQVSWRFVPTSHVMAIPPWGFPEKRTYTSINASQANQDFYGIKMGDVVTTFANPANFGGTDGAGLVLHAQDRLLQAGEIIAVEFRAEQADDIAAWQFALQFDPAQLEFIQVQPRSAVPLTTEHFGVFNLDAGEIRSVWAAEGGHVLTDGAPVFVLQFRVLQGGGLLSETMDLNEAELPAHVYNSVLEEAGVQLVFDAMSGTGPNGATPAFALLQNTPNPFTDRTTIEFVLPEPGEATLRIFDLNGRLLQTRSAFYAAGRNFEVVSCADPGVSGVLCYELRSQYGVLTRKMLAPLR